ncbi:MAG: hypothetical protein ACFE9S_02300 [Candidatus Hermodarchaeota archaeon]
MKLLKKEFIQHEIEVFFKVLKRFVELEPKYPKEYYLYVFYILEVKHFGP